MGDRWARLRELEAKATEGPWQRSGVRRKPETVHCQMLAVGPDCAPIVLIPIGSTGKDHGDAIRDAEFIAEARNQVRALLDERDALATERDTLAQALAFYADPETYFAIGFFPDPPCGDFIEDGSDCGPAWGQKPGKRARETLAALGYDFTDGDKPALSRAGRQEEGS